MDCKFKITGKSMSEIPDSPEIYNFIDKHTLLKEMLGYGIITGIIFTTCLVINLSYSEEHKELIERAITQYPDIEFKI
jgi:hypothetical protein